MNEPTEYTAKHLTREARGMIRAHNSQQRKKYPHIPNLRYKSWYLLVRNDSVALHAVATYTDCDGNENELDDFSMRL